ncbi:thymidylate kinase [Candidatus Termititenax persephonae]|uniref:Thymidylate kinase n=1 Tax=Candidatus Termititenax persephonae TaxID=2218525 RepID=A0A388TF79_9BACT|nr:thymidylate kinase [Candidatus Termititenax persephonae]
MFITFEGPDGSGKTTQSKLLYEELRRRGKGVVWTREPGGTDLGRSIRQLLLDDQNASLAPETELFLFAADRAQHVAKVLRPGLAAGQIVLCDRYVDSTTAYQAGGRGFSAELIASLNAYSTGGLLPDITFLLDVPSEIGLQRATRQKADKFEQESLAFHQKVRAKYLELAAAQTRIHVLDGLQTKEAIFQQIMARLDML